MRAVAQSCAPGVAIMRQPWPNALFVALHSETIYSLCDVSLWINRYEHRKESVGLIATDPHFPFLLTFLQGGNFRIVIMGGASVTRACAACVLPWRGWGTCFFEEATPGRWAAGWVSGWRWWAGLWYNGCAVALRLLRRVNLQTHRSACCMLVQWPLHDDGAAIVIGGAGGRWSCVASVISCAPGVAICQV